MKNFLNKIPVDLQKSMVWAMFYEARKYTEFINLGVEEHGFATSIETMEKRCKTLYSGKTLYAANTRIIGLKNEISMHLSRYNMFADPEVKLL